MGAWVYTWKQFGALPELFDLTATSRHPLQKVNAFSALVTHIVNKSTSTL